MKDHCALFWLKNYAPEEFKFKVNKTAPEIELNKVSKDFLNKMSTYLIKEGNNLSTDKELHEKMYEFIHDTENLEPAEAFKCLYSILISQEKGQNLAGFIRTIGTEKVGNLVNEVLG